MNTSGAVGRKTTNSLLLCAAVSAGVLIVLFFRSSLPGQLVFSNDGPYGGMVAQHNRMPAILTGYWRDLNWLGGQEPTPSPSISSAIRLVTSPLVFSKIFCPLTLLILGLCAWFCFYQRKLSPLACILGALAAMLNSHFFSGACWGVAAQEICAGMQFLALGLLADTTSPRRWARVALAGMAVGMGVMEGYDIGAICSLFIASFIVYQALALGVGSTRNKLFQGVLRAGVVTVCAVFLATQVLIVLVGTQIKGVAGMEQTPEARAERWDEATQWSLPKAQTLQLVISGLFGYRMDTPNGGQYWGEAGRNGSWVRYFESGRRGPEPQGMLRFTGGGEYAGVLVVAVALWAALQSLRKQGSVFSLPQRKFLWFWAAAAVAALLFAYGRYAPFYQFLYQLPYFSTIRNPAKFMHPFQLALVTLFAFGVDALSRRYLTPSSLAKAGAPADHRSPSGSKTTTAPERRTPVWLAHVADAFDRKWIKGSLIAVVVSLLGWGAFAWTRPDFEKFLQIQGFPDSGGTAGQATEIARFSLGEVGWYILFLLLTVALLTLVLNGWFAGKRAKLGAILLGVLLVVDLSRANLPWVLYIDYKHKYESNPIVDMLRDKPYEHRVALFPLERFIRLDRLPPEARPVAQIHEALNGLYSVEWLQHQFEYYNIQSLDFVMMPRRPVDFVAFESAMGTVPVRRWELTNTRYLLAPTALLDLLNQQLDPQHRFRIAAEFDIAPRAGEVNPRTFEQLTAVLNTNGNCAVFEFTGALPRAKLYSNWQVNTNDEATLKELASPTFDPQKTVLVADPLPASPGTTTNQSPGTVDFLGYAPKDVVLQAKASSPSILLLNDKFDPNWKVLVDGKPETLLRCNYLMRGVQVQPGEHRIEFRFSPPITGLYLSLAAIVLGLGLIAFLAIPPSKESDDAPRQSEAPVRASSSLPSKP